MGTIKAEGEERIWQSCAVQLGHRNSKLCLSNATASRMLWCKKARWFVAT
jgi:hypothetical protein